MNRDAARRRVNRAMDRALVASERRASATTPRTRAPTIVFEKEPTINRALFAAIAEKESRRHAR